MSKARDLANLLGGGTSGAITFGGTAAIRVPNGTTEQRPTPAAGMIRYNTPTGLAEVYDGSAWGTFGALPPSISSVSPSTYNGESGTTFSVNGANFTADATVFFITSGGTEVQAGSVTFVNSAQLQATTPQDFTVADEPLDVKVVQAGGVVTKLNTIDCGGVPTWNTSAGTVASIANSSSGIHATLSATDPEGTAVSYAIGSGSLPGNVSLNSSTGQISGDPTNVASQTTYNFDAVASDSVGNQTARSFSIIVSPDLEELPSTLAYFDFASGRSYDGSSTLQDLTSRNKDLPLAGTASYSSSNGGVINTSSNQNIRSAGLIGSINAISFGVWVKITPNTSTGGGVIWYGDRPNNEHFFIRDGIPYSENTGAYNFQIGKDVLGADTWTRTKYQGSPVANFITSISDYQNKYFFLVWRCDADGLVTSSVNGSNFETSVNAQINMASHSSGLFGIAGDYYDDNASSHSYGGAWWYNGVISQEVVNQEWNRYKSRFGF